MQRLPGERVPILLEDPFADLSIEVQAVEAWGIKHLAAKRFAAFDQATTPDAEFTALDELYSLFVEEAQPTWTLADHRGPIPPTVYGMWRLPLDLALAVIGQWISPPATAVDETVPPGPVRDELNRRLRAKRTTRGE